MSIRIHKIAEVLGVINAKSPIAAAPYLKKLDMKLNSCIDCKKPANEEGVFEEEKSTATVLSFPDPKDHQ